jgi:hypothetical protein
MDLSRRTNMPDKDPADQPVEIDPMDGGPLSDDDLETASGGIKPPTLTETLTEPGEPTDGSGGGG